MPQTKQPDKRKIIDWNKKSGNDSDRISKRMQGRAELSDTATTTNSAQKNLRPPRATGQPLLRLRQKIKEIYEEDEEEENTPLFNIELFEDIEEKKQTKQTTETAQITKQMELAGKLNLIMNTAIIAEEAGLSPKLTPKDAQLANTPQYDLKKVRRETLKDKVEKPLKLKGELPEDNISMAAKGLKKAKKALGTDSLEGFPAEDAEMLASLDEEDMAKLILNKSGRKSSKKSLSEIAKGMNRLNSLEDLETDSKENS